MRIHCIQQSSWRLHYSQTLGLFPYTGKSLNLMHKHLSAFSDLFLALSIVLRKAFKYPKIKGSNKVPKSGICNKKYTERLMPMISYRKDQEEPYNRNPNSQTWIHTEITKKLKTALCGLGLWVQNKGHEWSSSLFSYHKPKLYLTKVHAVYFWKTTNDENSTFSTGNLFQCFSSFSEKRKK